MFVRKGNNAISYKFMSVCHYRLTNKRWTEGALLYGPNDQVYAMPLSTFKKDFAECPKYKYELYKGDFDKDGVLLDTVEGYFALDAINKWAHSDAYQEKYGKFALKEGQAFLDDVKITYKKL